MNPVSKIMKIRTKAKYYFYINVHRYKLDDAPCAEGSDEYKAIHNTDAIHSKQEKG